MSFLHRAPLLQSCLIAAHLCACGDADLRPPAVRPIGRDAGQAQTDSGTPTDARPVLIDAVALRPIADCMLQERAFTGVGIGFPRSDDRLASQGDVNAVVLFADFSDVTADRTPEEAFALISPEAEEFFASVSYGRLNLQLQPHFEWLRLGPSSVYAAGITTFEGHRVFLAEAIDAADDQVDFFDADLVVVISTPNAVNIVKGPTWTGGDFVNGTLTPDGASIANGITSGADLTYWGFKWLPHEMGHSMSLVDLYSYDGPTGLTRPFSLMDDIGSDAPEYLAYERWFLGWLDDEQIICLGESATATLAAVENVGGTKAVIVPLTDSRALVVESRRAVGYDNELEQEGAVVYIVDTSTRSGHGPIQVLNGQAALREGEMVASEGVAVTVVRSSPEGDEVRIEIAR